MPSTLDPPVLAVRALAKSFEDRLLWSGVSLELNAGQSAALIGPSGSGKTTLLNCLCGVDFADSGEVHLSGHRLDAAQPAQATELRRRQVGLVFQFFHLLPTLSASENIELPMQLLGWEKSRRRQRLAEIIERIGLGHRAHALPSQLSGGEMQRVAIARAVVHQPALILADEPTGNLDARTGEAVLQLLVDLVREQGCALLMVTHSEQAAARCDQCLSMQPWLAA